MTSLRVLLVEDAGDDTPPIARELMCCGLGIELGRVGTEAELTAELARASWDLVILDYDLPGLGGLQALKVLHEQGFGGPAIVISGTAGVQAAVEAMRAGADDYIMKDRLSSLGPAIERTLREADACREGRRTPEALNAGTESTCAEARVSAERLRAVFDASPDGVMALTADGHVIDCNASIVEALGVRSVADVVGSYGLDFIAPEQREAAFAQLQEVLRVGAVRSLEYDVERPDGERFPVEVSANAISDQEGNRVGVVLALKDISARRAAEQEVQELNQFRHSIFDQANIWLHVLDRDLNTIAWNRAAAEISGISPEEALHSQFTWEVMYPDPDERESMMNIAREIIEDGLVLENRETRICTRSGDTRSISWHARRLLDADGGPIGLLAMGRDVTEHKQLETQLRQAVKMEAIGRLAGGIAHDFNNMLTAILGNVQLISMRMDQNDDNQRLLGDIRVAARRSADLTRQLLAFSRKQAREPEALDLNAVIERIEPMLQRMIGEDISVLTNLDPDLGLTMADPSQTDQVLMNLVVNARDAMPNGGILTIETANRALDESYAAGYADLEPGRYVMLSVSDTGIGMDRETQERIFEPFFTTKPEDHGTGLGLATVYGIVSQSGGHIYVYSEPGEGTTFKVYLPLLESGEAAGFDERASGEDLTGGETILLVEDEDIVRDLIATVLRRHGHSVLTAAGRDEALEVAAGYSGRIDIMVTDVVMPGKSGVELAEAMVHVRPEMPVLFISGYAENMIVQQGVSRDGVHYLPKPFDPEKLLRKIRAVLSGGK